MNIIIKTKGQVKMTDNVKEHINKQFDSVKKLFNESENVNVNVLCADTNNKFTCEITIVLKHVVLRSECKGDTLYAAIDLAVDKITEQLKKHKKKVNAIIKKREGIAHYFAEQTQDVEEPEEELVRIKHIQLTEMSVDEAITQMELVDHKFYMFKNEETHAVAVVYKRDSGGYGILESIE